MAATSPLASTSRDNAFQPLLADSQFTEKPISWHTSAPKAASREHDWTADSNGWKAWTRHLRKRRSPNNTPADQSAALDPSSLTWGLTDVDPSLVPPLVLELSRWAVGLESKKHRRRQAPQLAEQLRTWLHHTTVAPLHLPDALLCIAWARALPHLASLVAPDQWWDALNQLLRCAHASAGTTRAPLASATYDLCEQLLGGELPLLLAASFPEIENCRPLAATARYVLSRGIDRLLDEHGYFSTRHVAVAPALLACWTRCQSLAAAIDQTCWDNTSQRQFDSFARTLLAATAADRTLLLSGGQARVEPDLWQAVLDSGTSRSLAALSTLAWPKLRSPHGHRLQQPDLQPSVHSVWSGWTLLRSDWSRSSACCAVNFTEEIPRLDVRRGRTPLLAGAWRCEASCDGVVLAPTGPWEPVCHHSDELGEYLELEQPLAAGARLQRQCFLARGENWLLLADALLASQPGRLAYTGWFPFAADVSWKPRRDTREGQLVTAGRPVWVLPAALPEWRQESRAGDLTCQDDQLLLTHQAQGAALWAPLWIGLSQRRQADQLTWRRLTVAERREIVPSSAAAGVRIQQGSRQWLLYRALDGLHNRTVLGQNLVTEFMVGRLRRDGHVDRLLELE